MPTVTHSYNFDLSQTKLATDYLTLARVGLSSSRFNSFVQNLKTTIPQAIILRVEKTVIVNEDDGSSYDWYDSEIYIPALSPLSNYIELLSGCVPFSTPINMQSTSYILEQVNFMQTDEANYSRAVFDSVEDPQQLKDHLNTPFNFKGITDGSYVPDTVAVLRGYPTQGYGIHVILDSNLTIDDLKIRESKSPLFVFGFHRAGYWVFAESFAALVPLLTVPAPTHDLQQQLAVRRIVSQLATFDDQHHPSPIYLTTALNAYKLAYGYLTIGVINSILTNISPYTGLINFMNSPTPPSPEMIRAYIAEHVNTEVGRYGVNIQGLIDMAN